MLAWNAKVGYSLDKWRTQAACEWLVNKDQGNDCSRNLGSEKTNDAAAANVCVITKKSAIDASKGIDRFQLYRHDANPGMVTKTAPSAKAEAMDIWDQQFISQRCNGCTFTEN
jgi:hypothetical protein